MSADAKVWQDENGWHGICDATKEEYGGSHYMLSEIIGLIEEEMRQKLHWEIFIFKNGLGLRGYRAK